MEFSDKPCAPLAPDTASAWFVGGFMFAGLLALAVGVAVAYAYLHEDRTDESH